MSIPAVARCCFCFKLRTGSLVIGYVYSILALLELFMYTMIVTLRPMDVSGGGLSVHKFTVYTILAIVSFLQLLCGVMLVIGVTKKYALLMLPWTILTFGLSVFFVVICLTGASMMLQDTGDLLGEEAIMIFIHLTRACLSLYFAMVVHSHHKKIMEEMNERRFMHSARLLKRPHTII